VMLVCYVVAACVAPFLDDGQRPNTIVAARRRRAGMV
jgi:hypothetical protein